ncbi:MAG TPA: cytochrome c peroxidase [Planctomycetota bacterium]|nr:cytochrome c peroxidase [Planctomycetota bacterium]
MSSLRRARSPWVQGLLACTIFASLSGAQAPPPFPLPPVAPGPAGNPVTASKANLGKVLFWDEQLSSNRTVACGTGHVPGASGSDPRTGTVGYAPSVHAGADHAFGTADDVHGSLGVSLAKADGSSVFAADFRLDRQVTPRRSQGVLNSGFLPQQFWNGRAEGTFADPLTGAVVIAQGASLESQVLEPPLRQGEMGHVGRDWNDVAARIDSSTPLRLASNLPPALAAWINGRSYRALFFEAFGAFDVTPVRIAMAIATYERTLCSNQSPYDDFLAGDPNALTPLEQQGLSVFNGPGRCNACHTGPLLTDNLFHYNGIRPASEDRGRALVTGLAADSGAMKTPSLRNVELRPPYYHTGRLDQLEDVIDFYDRGGDFSAVNKPAEVAAIGLTQQQKDALLAFLTRPLTDPRVAAEAPPFDRPTLYSESLAVPAHYGMTTAGAGGIAPKLIAFEPAVIGNPHWTIAVDRGNGGKQAVLLISPIQWGIGVPFQGALLHVALGAGTQAIHIGNLGGSGAGLGFGSATIAIPEVPALIGQTFNAQWVIVDPQGHGQRLSATDAVEVMYQ